MYDRDIVRRGVDRRERHRHDSSHYKPWTASILLLVGSDTQPAKAKRQVSFVHAAAARNIETPEGPAWQDFVQRQTRQIRPHVHTRLHEHVRRIWWIRIKVFKEAVRASIVQQPDEKLISHDAVRTLTQVHVYIILHDCLALQGTFDSILGW